MSTLLMKIKMKSILLALAVFVAYPPLKDAVNWSSAFFNKSSIHLVDISFGTSFPWQNHQQSGYVKVSSTQHNPATPLMGPQIIYTRFKLSNPSSETTSFKKIWLTFKHENNTSEYTTDYNLYDIHTRQKLIGNQVQLAPNSEIELLASYRFIPSYPNHQPESIQISWEGKEQLRESSCELAFHKLAQNSFGHECN